MRLIQKGFTLIELIIVIAILGVLAAIAIPQFVDLRTEAEQASVDGIAGALAAGCAINYAACKAGDGAAIDVANCTAADGTLLGDALPSGYTITSAAITPEGTVVSCTLTDDSSSLTATFSCVGVDTSGACP